MLKYAKLINGKITFAPKNKGAILNYDLNTERLIADGYKPFIEAERHKTNRRYHIEYNETDDNILESIVYDETQEEADERELAQAKEAKQNENLSKCNEKRYNQEFTIELQGQICAFDTSEQTQRDLMAAGLVTSTGITYDNWVCDNGVVINLTNTDVQLVFAQFFMMISPLYTIEKQYAEQIEACTTIEEVDNIDIDYRL